MQFVFTLDWVSIVAGVVAVLSLVGSVFSAAGSARSADVALKAEGRIAAQERNTAERELLRSVAKIETEALMTIDALTDAIRTANGNATFYAKPEILRDYARTIAEIQLRIDKLTDQANHGLSPEKVHGSSDEWIAQTQLTLDRTLIQLFGEKKWASTRAEQLIKSNQALSSDIQAEETAKGVFQRRNADGKII